MARIRIFNQETNSYYNVDFTLYQSILDDTADGAYDWYLLVTTNMRTITGGTFPTFRVRDLTDVPPGYSTAADFTALCGQYIEYFSTQAELAQSSSSSSTSSSSSSSSELYSSSSSTSSSSSSTSSSSSESSLSS